MKIISGSSNPQLAKNISLQLNIPLVKCNINTFANGEKRILVENAVKNEEVMIIQSFFKELLGKFVGGIFTFTYVMIWIALLMWKGNDFFKSLERRRKV